MPATSKDILYDLLRSLPGVTEDVKWGNDLVFSVGDKMFAVFMLPDGEPLSFKVEEAAFASLTQQPGIIPAPYLARHSWVKLESRSSLPAAALEEMLRESYRLVAEKLPKKKRAALGITV